MRVVYASMWESPNRPHETLLRALRSVNAGTTTERLKSLKLKQLKVGLPGGFSVAGAFRGQPEEASEGTLNEITSLFAKIAGQRGKRSQHKTTLLMLDEIQHLGTSEAYMPLAANIRTAQDTTGSALKIIYTGSESATLQAMFGRRKGLFYASAARGPFPDLGKAYIEHLVKAFRERSRYNLTVDELTAAFHELGRNPGYLWACLQELLANPGRGIETACETARSRVAEMDDFDGRLESMDGLDRAIIQLIMDDRQIYAQSSRETLQTTSGRDKPITSSLIGKRIQSLYRKGILMGGEAHGEHVFQDDLFRQWLSDKL